MAREIILYISYFVLSNIRNIRILAKFNCCITRKQRRGIFIHSSFFGNSCFTALALHKKNVRQVIKCQTKTQETTLAHHAVFWLNNSRVHHNITTQITTPRIIVNNNKDLEIWKTLSTKGQHEKRHEQQPRRKETRKKTWCAKCYIMSYSLTVLQL